jgi:hypothetical protein
MSFVPISTDEPRCDDFVIDRPSHVSKTLPKNEYLMICHAAMDEAAAKRIETGQAFGNGGQDRYVEILRRKLGARELELWAAKIESIVPQSSTRDDLPSSYKTGLEIDADVIDQRFEVGCAAVTDGSNEADTSIGEFQDLDFPLLSILLATLVASAVTLFEPDLTNEDFDDFGFDMHGNVPEFDDGSIPEVSIEPVTSISSPKPSVHSPQPTITTSPSPTRTPLDEYKDYILASLTLSSNQESELRSSLDALGWPSVWESLESMKMWKNRRNWEWSSEEDDLLKGMRDTIKLSFKEIAEYILIGARVGQCKQRYAALP